MGQRSRGVALSTVSFFGAFVAAIVACADPVGACVHTASFCSPCSGWEGTFRTCEDNVHRSKCSRDFFDVREPDFYEHADCSAFGCKPSGTCN